MQTTGFREVPDPDGADGSRRARKGRVVVVTEHATGPTERGGVLGRLRSRPSLRAPRALPRADNALLGMEQRRHRRRWAVLAITVVALADVVAAVVPRT